LLNDHQVKYLIVDGYAVGFHSRPKFTQDLDVWIEPNEENADRVLKVLRDFGFGELEITVKDLTSPDRVIQLGSVPLRIDVVTSVSGLNFSKAFEAKVEGKYLGVSANFISVKDIIKNKKASGRKKDLEDIEWIKKYSKE
jgi:hypothetical protein